MADTQPQVQQGDQGMCAVYYCLNLDAVCDQFSVCAQQHWNVLVAYTRARIDRNRIKTINVVSLDCLNSITDAFSVRQSLGNGLDHAPAVKSPKLRTRARSLLSLIAATRSRRVPSLVTLLYTLHGLAMMLLKMRPSSRSTRRPMVLKPMGTPRRRMTSQRS
jgi:hypothetical protein